MLVQMLQTVCQPQREYQRGVTCDIEEVRARIWIERGMAVPVEAAILIKSDAPGNDQPQARRRGRPRRTL